MALDWIKWSVGLTKKREIGVLAKQFNVSRREMAATLMELWEWADNETMDGHVAGVAPEMLDEIVNVPGLAEAMASDAVGWLLIDDSGVIFPNFKRHNGKCAKKRALAADRKRQERDRLKELQEQGA